MRRINEIETKNSIKSAAVSIVTFFCLIVFLKFDLLISVVITTVLYFGVYYIIKPVINMKDYKDMLNDEEFKRFDEIMNEGYDKIKKLESYQSSITRLSTRERLKEVIETSKKIFSHIEENPQKIKYAKKFIIYYLTSLVSIIENYVKINNANDYNESDSLKNSIGKVEKALTTINEAFKSLFIKLMQNEVMDVDVEVELLEKTINSEGM